MNKFPQRLKELRKMKNVSQEKLGKKLNYGYTAIANYESGRNEPSFDTLILLADYLGVSVDYLLGASDFLMSDNNLLKNEVELLDGFRKLNERDKVVIQEFLKVLLKTN